MGLFKKIFSGDKHLQSDTVQSTRLIESDHSTDKIAASRNAARREMIHVVLRDTMRQHGIPSDWIDCRVITDLGRTGRKGLHVQLIVRHGHDRMLTYVPAFQGSFMQGVTKFDPRPSDWLLSLSWQFDGLDTATKMQPMPDRANLPGAVAMGAGVAAVAGVAALAVPATHEQEDEQEDEQNDGVSDDLKALYAIRDAAMQEAPVRAQADFQDTQPGG